MILQKHLHEFGHRAFNSHLELVISFAGQYHSRVVCSHVQAVWVSEFLETGIEIAGSLNNESLTD